MSVNFAKNWIALLVFLHPAAVFLTGYELPLLLKKVMVPEIIIVIERKFGLLFGYHNVFFSERFAINGKLFTTDAYCQGFIKDNSIICTNSSFNKVNVTKKKFLIIQIAIVLHLVTIYVNI